eukprot:4543291-Prymnesium_polylepis.1
MSCRGVRGRRTLRCRTCRHTCLRGRRARRCETRDCLASEARARKWSSLLVAPIFLRRLHLETRGSRLTCRLPCS